MEAATLAKRERDVSGTSVVAIGKEEQIRRLEIDELV